MVRENPIAVLRKVVRDHLNAVSLLFESQETRILVNEERRLAKMPRYTATKTALLGRKIRIVDPCTYLASMREIFEKKVYKFRSDRDDPLIIDCGANIGISTLYFKQLYPKARIIAFEPDPNIFEVLKWNVQAFEYSDVELHQAAVWNSTGAMAFSVEGGHSGRLTSTDQERGIKVNTVKLRDYLDKDTDFVKLDIEGGECDVIRDCRDALKCVRHLFIEYHSHENEPQRLQEILEAVTSAGFRYYIKDELCSPHPFVQRLSQLNFDLQLSIFCTRPIV